MRYWWCLFVLSVVGISPVLGYLGDGSCGQITSTSLPNREVQFALKYLF